MVEWWEPFVYAFHPGLALGLKEAEKPKAKAAIATSIFWWIVLIIALVVIAILIWYFFFRGR